VTGAQASTDGGSAGSAVPLPLDWPDGGTPGGFAVGPRILREVAGDIRALAADNQPDPMPGNWYKRGALGAVRALEAEPGLWASGRSVQHVHAQLREGVTAFHGALVAGLPVVAARLERSATEYERADNENADAVGRATTPLGTGVTQAPDVVGPDGRF
jgi:hypothetical protein